MKKAFTFLCIIIVSAQLSAQNAPQANDDTYQVNKNTTTLFPVLSNDFDIDGDPLSVSIIINPLNGVATITGTSISYSPAFNFVGFDTLLYGICDTTGLCDSAYVFITITGNNNTPVATDDYYTVPRNSNTLLPVLSNDYDPDAQALTVTILMPPSQGSASVGFNNQVTYIPNGSYIGVDSFSYIICDPNNECDTAIVYLTIIGDNTPPVASDDAFTFEDTLQNVWLDVTDNDYDVDNDYLNVYSVSPQDSSFGTFTIDSATHQITFTRTALACGEAQFTYLVCDLLACDSAVFTITINCPQDIFLPEGFSPDGDGKNDKLVFTDLPYFSPAKLTVFNRYGTPVYENEDYQNDWDGTNLETGKPVADGTYFYVLVLSDKRKYNSYLVIQR